ncbi:Hint domain-containing protein [Actinoplanes sp. NPDC026619]|uniref:Hint domain-containing protein n=1 Tax=Actinoplanes sp. NPDC026619 TaxID=3155798 RepID=UPI0033DD85B1
MSDPTGLMNPIGNRGDQNHNSCDDACREAAKKGNGGSSGSGNGKGKIKVDTEPGPDNTTRTRVCVTGINLCLDQYDVTNVNKYIDSYNAALAKISKRNGGKALEDFQYLQAMLDGCAADDKHLEANCSSQSYVTLRDISSEASIAAYEKANGVSAKKTAGTLGLTYLEIVMSRVTPCDLRVLTGGGGRRSFSADTLVLLGDGKTTKKFKDIKVGDEVLATDPETGEQGPRKVTEVWVHQDDLYVLLVDGKKLTTTEDHLFWDATDQRWERTDELDRGDLLQTPAGAAAHVNGFQRRTHKVAAAYNLTVEGLHTYYVLAGSTPVLVHNDGCTISPQGWKHVKDFHRPGGVGLDESKGVFSGTDEQVQDIIQQTVMRGRPRRNTGGRDGTVYEWDFGRPIGAKSQNEGGGEAQQVRVVVNPDGTLRTAHPF